MSRLGKLSSLLLLLLFVTLLSGTAQAGLLDVGPVVPEVNLSTEPNLGHGFPLWYRDANRLPLQLCTDRASGMCLTAEPNPGLTQRFPDNMGDELFWWVGDASIPIPQQGALDRDGEAILVQAIEAAFSTGDVVSGAQVSFARIRIRIDTPYAGVYLVTTPFKQFTFTVAPDLIDDGINHTEDIGIAEGGVFTGALNGSVGPFLYCTNAPIIVNGQSFVGDPNQPCSVRGSTFPSAENPSNFFRVQGPNGFDIQTDQFSVMGKLYLDPIPTPLDVGKVAYTRQASGVRINAFATTQALSNQTVPSAPFPANFALTGAASVVEVTAGDLPTLETSTNNPADGKFFGSTPLIPNLGTLPATATVTNSSDIPPTVRVVPLVDDVALESAMFNPVNNILIVSAASYDQVAAPALSLYMPGMDAPLGTLVDGKISVTFPVSDTTVDPVKTFNIPPEKVTVVSALGGSDTRSVTGLSPFAVLPTGTIVINGGAEFTNSATVTLTLSAASANGPVTQMQFSKDGTTWLAVEPFASTKVLTLLAGNGLKRVYVRYLDAAGKLSEIISAPITLDTVRPSGTMVINGGAPLTGNSIVNLTLSATDANGVTSMQFSNDGINYFSPVPYDTAVSLNVLPGDGVRTMLARFIDAAGNTSEPVSASTTLDTTKPTGTIAFSTPNPSNLPYGVMTLSAADASGVTQMQFSRDGINYLAFEPYATTKSMTLLPAGDGVKTIYVRFKDAAGNVSDPLSASITVETIKPTGTIAFTTPDPSNLPYGVMTLSAADASGVTQMQFSRDGVNYLAFEPYATTKSMTLLPAGDGVKTVYVRFKDAAGNISDPVSASITVITTKPTGTIAFTTPNPSNLPYAVMTLSATSANGQVTQMRFSRDGVNYLAFEPYATTKSMTLLPAGEGVKTVYVRFRDVIGNVSDPISASITVDTTQPTGTIAFSTPNPTTSATGTLELTATDASGVTQMQFSTNGVNYLPFEPFGATRDVALALGVNNISVRFKDAAGNVSTAVSATITRNP